MKNIPLNIIYVAPYNLSQPSAPAINVLEMCNAFSKKKCDTSLCVPKSGKDKDSLFQYYGVDHPFEIIEIDLPKIFRHHKMPGQKAVFAILASQKLRKMKNHLIYTRTPWIFFIMSVLYKQRCFFEAHQFRYVRFMQSSFYRSLVKLSVVFGNGVIVCISKTLMKQWEKYGINRERLFVAHDAVNTKKFHNLFSKQQARKQLHMKPEIPLVVYTGSLLPGKGVDVLIKSANRLPRTSFVIVGGKQEQIATLSKLVQHGNVIFTGQVHPAQMPLYQAAADVLVLPNTKGSVIDDVTSPMKLFEYMASNRPIVATDVPSIMEILVNNHNALISQSGNNFQLSQNIDMLLKNPSLSKLLASNAFQILDKYTWDSRAGFLTELFNNTKSMRAASPKNVTT
ncbi:MAG: glycosyltransferase family 4 protein [Desulfobacteraceae bacterium]|nr:glycosyltransferase family 4 protein [Desulfobacteraceae bacterium]